MQTSNESSKISINELVRELGKTAPHEAVTATVEGKGVDFTDMVTRGEDVELFDFDTPLGKEVFWHTSAHVLAQAIMRLYPEAQATIGPPIENGFYYDFANLEFSESDFKKVEAEAAKIVKENFRPEKVVFKDKQEAIEAFGDNPYKVELIESFDEGSLLTGYRQGEFFDLCRGPHIANLGKIKAFKLLKTSCAYWRGDPERGMLTRIYGVSFPSREMMKEHLHRLEEAKKRDHRRVGTKLDLFSFHDVAAGMVFMHPKGMRVWNHLIDFWKERHTEAGYVEIKTPIMLAQELWETSGHWDHYRENMYTSEVEKRDYAIKPMNCPGGMVWYKTNRHSYRDFPLRVAELGHVHRYEKSGSLNGLFRVRSFHQDDAHIFMREDQIKDEILAILRLVEGIYHTFSLSYHLELSTRPEKSIGTDEEWEITTGALREALDEWGQPYVINEGDGAFYGPKIDMHIKDAIGRTWQCGTIQLDSSLPEKFELEYTDSDGQIKRPIMLHRALFGSIERFLGILIEHYVGRFPLWMSPVQVRVVSVADRHADFAKKVQEKIQANGLDCSLDTSSESVGKKIRNAQTEQVNYMLTIGDQEVEKEQVALRTRNGKVIADLQLEQFIETAKKEMSDRAEHSYFEEDK